MTRAYKVLILKQKILSPLGATEVWAVGRQLRTGRTVGEMEAELSWEPIQMN